MQKIPTIFARDYEGDGLARDEPNPACAWVFAGEGVATRKYDGTCCLVRDGRLYRRHDAKRGKPVPPGFEPCGEPDPVTGHHPGWVVVGDSPAEQWHREAWNERLVVVDGSDSPQRVQDPEDGTYELCGPKIQGNPEGFPRHVLVRHGACVLCAPRSFDGLREYLMDLPYEGIVWHHPDGRMAKLTRAAFLTSAQKVRV